MKTSEVRDFLKTLNQKFSKYYAGKLDNEKKQSLCVYSMKSFDRLDVAIGGDDYTTKQETFSILIHYNENYSETEEAAQNIFNELKNIRNKNFVAGEKTYNINYIKMLSNEPIDANTDEHGIYERVIDIRIYYK